MLGVSRKGPQPKKVENHWSRVNAKPVEQQFFDSFHFASVRTILRFLSIRNRNHKLETKVCTALKD